MQADHYAQALFHRWLEVFSSLCVILGAALHRFPYLPTFNNRQAPSQNLYAISNSIQYQLSTLLFVAFDFFHDPSFCTTSHKVK